MVLAFASNATSFAPLSKVTRDPKSKDRYTLNLNLAMERRNFIKVSSALPETAASVGIAATIVGAAAALLVKRTKSSDLAEVPLKICEDCSGTGICSECKGEGFVLKKMSEESAEKARMTSKNMATRYTAGYSYVSNQAMLRTCLKAWKRIKI
ncbi:hypothetical protein Ancab_012882 [Ancistrocladus abbreviatus]